MLWQPQRVNLDYNMKGGTSVEMGNYGEIMETKLGLMETNLDDIL